jgi:ketosteroid isomerase-like protein
MSQFADPQFPSRLDTVFLSQDPNAADKHKELENVRRVEQMLATIASGNLNLMRDYFDDEMEMEIQSSPESGMSGHHQGVTSVMDALERNFSMLEDQKPIIEQVEADGDEVVVTAKESGRFKGSGQEYAVRLKHHFKFKDGKVVQMREIVDPEG